MFVEGRGHGYGVRHFKSPKSGDGLEVIAAVLELKNQDLRALVELGAVYLNEKRVAADDDFKVNIGDYLRVHTTPRRFDISKIDSKSLIVSMNDQFIVVNKPSALPVHATVDNIQENLVAILEKHLGEKPLVTHRLDTATNGLLILARTTEFQKKFNGMLRAGQVQKLYRASVEGANIRIKFPEGLWVHYMAPSPRAPKSVRREQTDDSQKCVLEILSEKISSSNISDIEIRLHTGRTHQIRAQLSCEGHPIVGDVMYGSTIDLGPERIALQSSCIQFDGFHFAVP